MEIFLDVILFTARRSASPCFGEACAKPRQGDGAEGVDGTTRLRITA